MSTPLPAPDPALFSVISTYRVRWHMLDVIDLDIEAASEAEAMIKAHAIAGNIGGTVQRLDDLIARGLRHRIYIASAPEYIGLPSLFRVLRAGKPMQVAALEPGDEPREPEEETGF